MSVTLASLQLTNLGSGVVATLPSDMCEVLFVKEMFPVGGLAATRVHSVAITVKLAPAKPGFADDMTVVNEGAGEATAEPTGIVIAAVPAAKATAPHATRLDHRVFVLFLCLTGTSPVRRMTRCNARDARPANVPGQSPMPPGAPGVARTLRRLPFIR